ncbi:nickel ABC transporter permease [Tepidibacter mesophilus]|uniref:nickel ABC transporter permease n=1 Tax=Tepidibacter mesophilus TaxID=655607 RepID=UPI000C080919|nr:nickel ABC transporter permease [Tepidibacter mesophilus]
MKNFTRQLFKVLLFFLLLSFFSFIIVKLAPGDPVMSMLRVDDIATSKKDIEQLRETMGLNRPLMIQYIIWLKQVIKLDFGNSVMTGKSVVSGIVEAFPSTLILAMTSLIVMSIIAVPLGIASAFYRNGFINKISELFNLIGSSVPGFWLGFILVDIFAIKLKLLPSMGIGGVKHLILPAITLGISMAPPYIKLLKNSLIDSMEQDFIRAARARGVSDKRIFFLHILRNSLIPVITVFGLSMGSLMGGTVVIEVLFSYPGLGKLAIDSIVKRDYAMVQGFILFIGGIVFVINVIVDISYRFIDPSISIKEGDNFEI